MSLPICRFFLNGHCKLKSQCPKSHKILTCFLGPYCKSSSCSLRHPKNCENFRLNSCNYPSCNHFHPPVQFWYNHTLLPPIVHPPNQPPYHPPSGLPHSTYPSPTPPPSHVPLQPTYSSELGLLKTKVQQLVTELESIKSNIQTQNHENGSSEDVTVNDILTIKEENQDITTGSTSTDIQEGAGSAPHSPENNKEKVSTTDLQSKFLDLEAELQEFMKRIDQDKEINTKLITFTLKAEEWQMTLDNLTTSAQGLEGRVTSDVDNRFKGLEIKIQQVCQQEVVNYLSGANGGIDLEKVLRGIPSDINCMKTSRQAAGITQIISKNNDVTEDVFDNSPNIANQEMAERFNNWNDSMGRQVAGITKRINTLEEHMIGQCNNNDLTAEDVFDSFKTASITEEIAVIQHYLKRRKANQKKVYAVEKKKVYARERKLSKRIKQTEKKVFIHLEHRVRQCENSSACNTYMLDHIKDGVYDCLLDEGLPHPTYTEFKQRLQKFNNNISECNEEILKAKPHHWFHAPFNPALEAVLR